VDWRDSCKTCCPVSHSFVRRLLPMPTAPWARSMPQASVARAVTRRSGSATAQASMGPYHSPRLTPGTTPPTDFKCSFCPDERTCRSAVPPMPRSLLNVRSEGNFVAVGSTDLRRVVRENVKT
jgi:hypothetical protein